MLVTFRDIDEAMAELKFSNNEQALVRKFISLEVPRADKTLGEPGYKVVNWGNVRGLGQFKASTWANVSSYPYAAAGSLVPDVLAIRDLINANKRTFENQWGSDENFTANVAYLYHNQGAGRAKAYLSETNSAKRATMVYRESDAAKKLFAEAYGEFHG